MNAREKDAHLDLCRRLATALAERDAARAEVARLEVVAERLRHFIDSPIGNRCVTCGHVKHNDLGYCQTGRCGCEDGTTVQGLARIVQRDLRAALDGTR